MNHFIYPKTRLLYKWTSVWILVPCYASLPVDPVLHVCLIISFIASLLHWHYYAYESMFHNLDRIASTVSLSRVLFSGIEVTVNPDSHATFFGLRFSSFLALLSIFIFLSGRYAKNSYHLRVNIHLLFRYVAFWACCSMAQHASVYTFIVYTILYISHIKWLQLHTSKSKKYRKKKLDIKPPTDN